jgi:hypothetical protein
VETSRIVESQQPKAGIQNIKSGKFSQEPGIKLSTKLFLQSAVRKTFFKGPGIDFCRPETTKIPAIINNQQFFCSVR